jgi:hypothetical protein
MAQMLDLGPKRMHHFDRYVSAAFAAGMYLTLRR